MHLFFFHELADDLGVVLGRPAPEGRVRVFALLGLLRHLVLEQLAVLAEALALAGRGRRQLPAQKVHTRLHADLLRPRLLLLVVAAARVESAAAALIVFGRRVCGVGDGAQLLLQVGILLEELGEWRVAALGLVVTLATRVCGIAGLASTGRLGLVVVDLTMSLGAGE